MDDYLPLVATHLADAETCEALDLDADADLMRIGLTLCPNCNSDDVYVGSSHFSCRRCPEIWPVTGGPRSRMRANAFPAEHQASKPKTREAA